MEVNGLSSLPQAKWSPSVVLFFAESTDTISIIYICTFGGEPGFNLNIGLGVGDAGGVSVNSSVGDASGVSEGAKKGYRAMTKKKFETLYAGGADRGEVKNEAKDLAEEEYKDYVIVDGSPGIGCPVVSSLSGANLVVLVTESSISGLHDLKRVYELVKKFKLKAACIINKSDINKKVTKDIEKFLKDENIIHLSNLPYNENFTKAMTEGKTIVEFDDGLKQSISDSWEKIKDLTNKTE